jgi:hypothetical protein
MAQRANETRSRVSTDSAPGTIILRAWANLNHLEATAPVRIDAEGSAPSAAALGDIRRSLPEKPRREVEQTYADSGSTDSKG